MQMATSKALYFAAFKGHQLSLKGVSFETGALYASRSDFICDQTREQWSCADLEVGVGSCGGFGNTTAPLAAVWVREWWGSVWAQGGAGACLPLLGWTEPSQLYS